MNEETIKLKQAVANWITNMRGRKRTEMDHALALKFSVDAFNEVPECTTCPGRFETLMDRLANFAQNDIEPISKNSKKPTQMGQFKAKTEKLLFDSNRQVHINSKSASDADIISLLHSNQGAIKHFDAPDNWEDLVEAHAKQKEAEFAERVKRQTGRVITPATKKTSQSFAAAMSNAKNFEEVKAEIEGGTKKGLLKLAKMVGVEVAATATTEAIKEQLIAAAAKEFEVSGDDLSGKTLEELQALAQDFEIESEGKTREELIAELSELAG